MDASEELALIREIDFDVATTAATEQTEKTRPSIAVTESAKTRRNRKKKAKRNAAARNTQSQLDPMELLFFPEHLNVRPRDETPPTQQEKRRGQMYKSEINKMSDSGRREFRTKRDIRYLHQQKDVQSTSEPSSADLPCLHHVAGKCEHKVCLFNHQMRLPRQFGVCRFYLKNACTKGNACLHMHSEFPCKFYYLGMPHPNNLDAANCRFTHGDVLNENTKRLFLKQIEFWVKEKTAGNADDFEREMNAMITRFEEQEQKILSERDQQQETAQSNEGSVDAASTGSPGETLALHKILNEAQIRRLAADKITSVEQLRRKTIAELEHYRLTMDQIYEIKSKRFKADHSDVDEPQECVEEPEPDPVDADDKPQNQPNDVSNVESVDESDDTIETQSKDPIIEKGSEVNSDESDSDDEDRLVINDEL